MEMIKEDQKRARTKDKAADISAIFEVQVLEKVAPTRSILEEGELNEIVEGKATRVASELGPGVREDLIACLRRNAEVFARDVYDSTGIDSRIVEHHLNITKGVHPVKQRKRHFRPEKNKVIIEEVKKLLLAGHIKEV